MRKKMKGGYTYGSHNEDSGRSFNISDEDKKLFKIAIICLLVSLILCYLLYKLATLLSPKLGMPATMGIMVGIIIIIFLALYFGLKWYNSTTNSISITPSVPV